MIPVIPVISDIFRQSGRYFCNAQSPFVRFVAQQWTRRSRRLVSDCRIVADLMGILTKVHNFALLLKLNISCHFSDHVTSLSRCCCRSLSRSLSSIILLKIFASSANFKIQFLILQSRSMMQIRNSKGPNTEHCGTPHTKFDKVPVIPTRCFLRDAILTCARKPT